MPVTQEQINSLWWNRPVVFWHENQVALTFHSGIDRSGGVENVIASLKLNDLDQFLQTSGFSLKSFTAKDVPHPEDTRPEEIEKLEAQLEALEAELEALERTTRRHGSSFWSLLTGGEKYKTPGEREIEELEGKIEELEREIEKREQSRDNGPQAGNASNGHRQEGQDGQGQRDRKGKDLNSTTGKYLFNAPSGQGTIVVCFFHGQSSTMASSISNMKSMMGRGRNDSSESDNTQAIVTLINRNLEKLRRDGSIPIIAAMPNWIGGGTPPVGHGCPITPPIPVSGSDACAAHPGSWPITLPELSPTMNSLQGDGVTVFVLDTIPELDQIRKAAENAGDKNELLKDMVARMDNKTPSPIPPAIIPPSIIIDHQQVPKRIETNIQTGKDVYQRLFGFKMPDHGLFVAGIIHDLVPQARIECIRVLNDSGIGDFAIICKALEDIQGRMETEPQKLGQVVVNMSLVITPADEEIAGLWFGDDFTCHAGDLASMMQEVKLLRLGLHMVIRSLTTRGAVVAASAGNDSKADPRLSSMGMNMGMDMPSRLGPRYPAAFPEVISAGAVFKDGSAASYSNFPALPPNHNGIATHGGGLPTPIPYNPAATPSIPIPPPGAKTWAIVTDAVIGVYSAGTYSMLSASDLPPEDYRAPADSNAWAYWSGTSFATPVISAVAARALQGLRLGVVISSKSVQDIITTASGQQAILAGGTTLSNNTEFGVGVSVLTAEQNCQPAAKDAILSGSSGAVQKN